MKRLWLGVVIMLVLLAVGFWTAGIAEGHGQSVCQELQRAQQAAQLSDWHTAQAGAAAALKKWEDGWDMWAALSDHTVLDEVDAGFARLEVYGRDGHATDFAAGCAALIRQIEALGEAHRLSWQNLM